VSVFSQNMFHKIKQRKRRKKERDDDDVNVDLIIILLFIFSVLTHLVLHNNNLTIIISRIKRREIQVLNNI
jgi:hypothetical protein